MNQIKHILSSLFEPLTKNWDIWEPCLKIIMILIYIIVALIVIAILNKVIEQAFKIQNKSKKEVKTFKNAYITCTKRSKIYCMVYRTYNHFKQIWY